MASPRIERLTEKFGPLSIFLSKYVYGLRTASCVFYGVWRMPPAKFLTLTLVSCFLWVFVLTGAGYFFSGAITQVLGDFHQLGMYLLVIVVIGIAGFTCLSATGSPAKVEHADAERIQEFEHAAQEKLHELGDEIKEHMHPLRRHQRGEKLNVASKSAAKQI
ncbi:MAG: DedA family protein [Pyrinomonadaceae bacterium]